MVMVPGLMITKPFFIQQKIIDLFTVNGCRLADPGEFTLRAFLNGKMEFDRDFPRFNPRSFKAIHTFPHGELLKVNL